MLRSRVTDIIQHTIYCFKASLIVHRNFIPDNQRYFLNQPPRFALGIVQGSWHWRLVQGRVRYEAERGGFSLCDPRVTPARGKLFAVPLYSVSHRALAGLWGGACILLSPLIA